jgi:hypothetical protein
MSEPPAGPVEVLSGSAGDGLRWVVVADGRDEDLGGPAFSGQLL